MSALDSPAVYEQLDAEGLIGRIRELPRQCGEAWRQAAAFKLPRDYWRVERLVILGMGGSAIAGDMLQALLSRRSRASISVVRGYELPASVDENTLVVASSHSGETEEVLTTFARALGGPAKKAVITSGGRLAGLAREREIPAFVHSYRGEARAALPYSLMPLLSIAEQAQLMENAEATVAEAIDAMVALQQQIDSSVAAERNTAKRLAESLLDRVPVILGGGLLAPVARRWKTQMNENAKVWAIYEELPEANHNAIAGYTLPRTASGYLKAVFLSHAGLHPRLALHYEANQRELEAVGVPFETVDAGGNGDLARMLAATLYGDYVSYYLGLLNGISPSPTRALADVKRLLAAEPP